jgi:hypothetical protein
VLAAVTVAGLGVVAFRDTGSPARADWTPSSACLSYHAAGPPMGRMRVVGHNLYAGGARWRAWGFNWGIGDHSPVIAYFDHPTAANLAVLACELRTAHRLGANSMRVYLELQQVMQSPRAARASTLAALRALLRLAERDRVYLDITGNLVWRPQRAPDWYDRLGERARWQVQANFWRAVARTAATSPAVLCYELTSEPVISDQPGWYTGEFGGWWFEQVIAHPHGRATGALARSWTRLLSTAIRAQDDRPVTIGFVSSLHDGFIPANVADQLDMLALHQYPVDDAPAAALDVVRTYASFRKPVLLGETYPLWCGCTTEQTFLKRANRYIVGAFEFFNGQDPNHMTAKTPADALYVRAIRDFTSLSRLMLAPPQASAQARA